MADGGGPGVSAPAPISAMILRILALRDVGADPEVQRAVGVLSSITRAEQAAQRGVSGTLLDRAIVHLERGQPSMGEISSAVDRLRGLAPTVSGGGYF